MRTFLSYIRPFFVFGLSFLLVSWGTVNTIRYQSFVSALQQHENIPGNALEDVLAETDSIEDLLITFNYETIFAQPVEFQQDITAPNILYSLSAGDGISLSGDSQKPSITNTGVLTINGLAGDVSLSAGENITLVKENGVLTIKSTDTNTDTKLSESEVEAFVFDGESTGSFTELEIGDILLSDEGTTATTSGSSLVGVYQGNLSEISGANVQEIIDSIDSTLASLGTSSHGEVTFAGSLDYLTLTGQEITLNQIDLTTDVSGILPTGHISGSYSGITGVGTITSGTWQGSIIDSAYLDTDVILSTEIDTYTELNTIVADVTLTHNGLIDTSAELAGIIGDETGSGGLVFANSPTFTGTLKLTDSSTTTLNFDSLGSSTWGNVITSTNFAENAGIGFGIGGNSSMTDIPRFVLNADNSYIGWAMRPGDGGALGSTNGDGNLLIRGNMGIGTTNPGATLDVQGAAQFGSGNVDLINSTGKIAAINTTYFASVDGSALTNLNASNLTSGTVASAQISGSYTGITGVGTIATGTWQGTDISATYLDSTLIQSTEIDTSAEIAAIVTNETGSGALVFGTSPTLTTPNIGAATGTSLNVTGAITSGGVVTGTGSGLTGLNASNLSSGTVPDARITGAYTGLTNLTGSGTATFASFSGNGSALTNLNATNLSSGTVASARISGSYTGITGLGTIATGTWQGTDISATYLDSTLIQSTEIDTSAEIAAIVTNETGSGALVFGTSPTLTTPNIGAATGTSLSVSGTISGNGSGLTSLNASNLGSGTVPDGRISGSYTGLTNLTGSGTSTFGSFSLSSNGSRTTPAIRWSADTNMGIYRLGTDILSFATAGADRLTINASGNVGIGTTSISSAKLVLNGGTGTGMSIVNTGDTALGLYVLNWDDGDGIYVESGGGDGINSFASFGDGVYGGGDNGVHGGSYYGNAVYGEAITSSAWAGYFLTPGVPAVARFVNGSGTCDIDPTFTTLICSSDQRLKRNISTISNALDKLMLLRGVNYNWKTDSPGSPNRLGFIAQEVESIFPELVITDGETGYKQLASNNLIAVVVNAIQEQQQTILENKANIESVNIRLNDTGEVLDVIQAQNQQLVSSQNNLFNQINLVNNIQTQQNASTGATLQTVIDRVEAIEEMTNDTDAVIAGLQDRVSQLESLFATQTATDAATLTQNTGNVLGISDELDLETLTVTGDTNINNLGVTGDITAGLLSIKGFDDELATPSAIISTISGPLKIQDQSAGNLEIMGGKVLIDTDGNIMVRGSITVNKLNIDESEESNKSIGEGIITSGQNEVVINTTSVTDKSRIFVTGKSVISTPLVVVEKNPGVSFKVRIGNTAESDIPFDWLVVN
ncbi:tail fiber domain-containing protein [Candidatus Roizmanbacteria bacterium]|nr:MAG: tail fiber domain-containing protein [Candidatus Roizmanbacteria bacterium]